jgi:hypothetical protein
VRCAGEPGGNVEVLTTGGTPPYQYAWNTGQTTEDLAAVPVGVYVLTATDANGCTTELPAIVLTEPLPLVVTPSVVDIPCTGPITGDIGLTVSGGLGPYQYLWSNGGTTQHIYDLPAGAYEVTVLDALGCAYLLDSLEVRDLEAFLAVDTLEVLPVSCSGQTDGRIAVQLNNGTPPFQFIWSAPVGLHPNVPVPFDVAANLSGGVYQVTVSDANDCVVVSEPFLIEEAPPLLIGLLSVTGVLCYGDTTGGVDLSFSGGLPPYTYSWSNGADTNDPGPLPAGTFFLTVTDQRSCTAVSPAVIVQQPAQPPAIVLDDLQPDACGNGEGAILLHITGGTPPNTYLWSNGDTTASIGGLPAGTYQLTVTDEVGCTLVSPSYLVTALVDPLQLASSSVVPVICPDAATGSISLKIEGGTPGYNYFWSHGPLTPNASGLPAGAYTLTVTDAEGCTDAFSFTVTGPPDWNIASTSTFSGGAWSVQLTVSGATPGYDIVWDGATGNQTGPVASGLAAGTYGYTVTDSEGCTVSGLVMAGTTGTGEPGAGLYCRVEPNPTTGTAWAVLRLPAAQALQVWLLDGLGRELTTVQAGPASGEVRLPLDLSARPAGLYWLRIRVESGESRTLPIVRER